jgi:hypothetical protein
MTDQLGAGAPVVHATTPTDRSLSVSKFIVSSRGDAPVSHINDAEVKIFEFLRPYLSSNSTGDIYVLTAKGTQGTVLGPLAPCASCTNAGFQMAGDFPGIRFVFGTPPYSAPTLDLNSAVKAAK